MNDIDEILLHYRRQGGVKSFDYSASVAWRETTAATSEPDKKPRLLLQGGWRF